MSTVLLNVQLLTYNSVTFCPQMMTLESAWVGSEDFKVVNVNITILYIQNMWRPGVTAGQHCHTSGESNSC